MMKRVGQVIRIRPEKETYCKELHALAWPGVPDMIKRRSLGVKMVDECMPCQ